MASIQEIWLPAHGTTDNLWHAAAHCVAERTSPECQALEDFVHQRGLHASHEPLAVLEDTHVTVCIYHHGAQYRVYAIGAPEQILDHCVMSENEREKALLESRRIDKHNGERCRVVSVATGIYETMPTTARSITQLTCCGHVAIAGPF